MRSSIFEDFVEHFLVKVIEGECYSEGIPIHPDDSFMCNLVDVAMNISKYGTSKDEIEPFEINTSLIIQKQKVTNVDSISKLQTLNDPAISTF